MIRSRRMRYIRHAEHMGYLKKVYRILLGKPDYERSPRRPGQR
jgi:hypothetical protein